MFAAITAGGPIDGEYAALAGTTLKALAPVRGSTMLDRTIRALREIGTGKIAVVGNDRVADACGSRVERIVPDTGTGAGNLLAGLNAWGHCEDERLLLVTCDMPYIDAASLRKFVDAVGAGVLAMPLTEQADFAARFPGAPEFGITLAGERVVNGGVFHIPTSAIARVRSAAAAMFDARKYPWRMARVAGPTVLVRFLFRQLSIAHVERRARDVLELDVRAVRGSAPELAYDADTVDEYRYACTNP
jgi:hypothetical protein